MKRTYIQVKKLNDLLGVMTSGKVEVHVYKKLSYKVDDCIFTAVMYAKELHIAFDNYWVYAIMPTIVNEYGAIKMLVCIDRPDGHLQEVSSDAGRIDL